MTSFVIWSPVRVMLVYTPLLQDYHPTVLDDDMPGWLDDEGVFDADTLLYLGRKFCDQPVKDLAHGMRSPAALTPK